MSFSLALRFLVEFSNTYRAIEQAQQSRGLDLSQARGVGSIRARMPIFIAMLITTLHHSERMAIALEARAFESGGSYRTDLDPLEFRTTDALFVCAILLLAAAALLARFGFGWGAAPMGPSCLYD